MPILISPRNARWGRPDAATFPHGAMMSDSAPAAPVLELREISKRFPGVVALNDVAFDLRAGEVHVLVGENGAGKSTLVKILSGIYQPDAGEILLDGNPVTLPDPHTAQQLGISTVHQELNLVPHLDVGRNMYLGREPVRGVGVIDWPALYRGASAQLTTLGMSFDPHTQVRSLGVALQQMTEIAKALVAKARVSILDEPTAAITMEEADQLSMAAPDKLPSPPGLVPPVQRTRVADRFIQALRIRTPSSRQRVVNLSGGNQQKVVLAKWLLTEADIFFFDEPTRGIDVGAKVEVYRLMNELLARGAAIVMISSELPEVLGMSDRILVMREGRIVAELDGGSATQESVMTLAAAAEEEVA